MTEPPHAVPADGAELAGLVPALEASFEVAGAGGRGDLDRDAGADGRADARGAAALLRRA